MNKLKHSTRSGGTGGPSLYEHNYTSQMTGLGGRGCSLGSFNFVNFPDKTSQRINDTTAEHRRPFSRSPPHRTHPQQTGKQDRKHTSSVEVGRQKTQQLPTFERDFFHTHRSRSDCGHTNAPLDQVSKHVWFE